jgi:hypothetical protein
VVRGLCGLGARRGVPGVSLGPWVWGGVHVRGRVGLAAVGWAGVVSLALLCVVGGVSGWAFVDSWA